VSCHFKVYKTAAVDPVEDLPQREPAALFEASMDDIAARIAALTRENTSWVDPRARPRMSLAGAQGKFTLARVGDQWFWPTYEVPSTHR
jgi:serine/threonine-protein kinase HipA